jgi:hypothetical protein
MNREQFPLRPASITSEPSSVPRYKEQPERRFQHEERSSSTRGKGRESRHTVHQIEVFASAIFIQHALIAHISRDDFATIVDDELVLLQLDFRLEAPPFNGPGIEHLQTFPKPG